MHILTVNILEMVTDRETVPMPSNWKSCISFRQTYLHLNLTRSKCKNVKVRVMPVSHKTGRYLSDLLKFVSNILKMLCRLLFNYFMIKSITLVL